MRGRHGSAQVEVALGVQRDLAVRHAVFVRLMHELAIDLACLCLRADHAEHLVVLG